MTLHINLYAGPGIGKSVTAASLFVTLKMAGVHAELCTEVAKDLTYDGVIHLTPQLDIIKAQYARQARYEQRVDVVITDAPLPMSLVYCTPDQAPEVAAAISERMAPWTCLNVLLHRDLREGFEAKGRYQSQDEAIRFHADRLAPFVRDYHAGELLELHVSEAVATLAAKVQAHFAGLQADLN